MSTQPNTPAPELFPEWHDPFVKPQTIPSGWDLSAMRLDLVPSEDEEEAAPPAEHPAP
jgi:hypothetical protein